MVENPTQMLLADWNLEIVDSHLNLDTGLGSLG